MVDVRVEVFRNLFIFFTDNVRLEDKESLLRGVFSFPTYCILQRVLLITYITLEVMQPLHCFILIKKAFAQLKIRSAVQTEVQSWHGVLRQGPQPLDKLLL